MPAPFSYLPSSFPAARLALVCRGNDLSAFRRLRVAWRCLPFPALRQTAPDGEDKLPGYLIVLARRSEFAPAEGAPVTWKPAAGYGFGTARLSRELGLGELLSYRRMKQGAVDQVQNTPGVNLFGGVLDWTETVECGCVVSLLTAEDEPEIGDEFRIEGGTYLISYLDVTNGKGAERALTLRGVRWNGLNVRHRREGKFPAPTLS